MTKQIKEIAKMWQELAENEDAYFENIKNRQSEWEKTNLAPNIDSDLDNWRVTIPPKKWTPTLKKYQIDKDLKVYEHWSHVTATVLSRNTVEQAERLANKIRTLATISAYVDEHDGHAEFVYGQENHFIVNIEIKMYEKTSAWTNYSPERVYMTKSCAVELADKINSGEIEI